MRSENLLLGFLPLPNLLKTVRCHRFDTGIETQRTYLHQIYRFSRKHLTAEIAENAEKEIIGNLCGLSELCGELKCFSSDQTGRFTAGGWADRRFDVLFFRAD